MNRTDKIQSGFELTIIELTILFELTMFTLLTKVNIYYIK